MKIKLTRPLTAKEIKETTGATLHISGDTLIESIATHSDEVEKNTLFLSFLGENTHGDVFLPRVLERGGYMMTEAEAQGCITVSSVTDALFALAKAHLRRLADLKHTVAITGSAGKTTTKEILFSLTKRHFRTHSTVGNQNSEIGLPLTVLCAPLDTECLILEMGMNHKGEIARLSRLCEPTLAIITNIGHAHIGNLGSLSAIAEAKMEILCGMKPTSPVLIPAEEPLLASIENAITVGEESDSADYKTEREAEGFALSELGRKILFFSEKMQDRGMRRASAFASAAALRLGIPKSAIQNEILNYTDNIFRQKNFLRGKAEIVFDGYNASFESVLCALDALKSTKKQERTFVLGDMLELGDYTRALHERLGLHIGALKNEIQYLFLFGESGRFTLEGALSAGFARERIHLNPDKEHPEITAKAILSLSPDKRDMRLTIKGARGMKMERILDILIKETGGDGDAG